MNIWTTLSPEWQQFLVGTAGNALGGLAATFVDSLLRAVGRRVGETFRLPPRQQALERAAESAITAVIADWQIPNPDYQDLWDRFGAWLLNPAVLGQFRVLLTPSADIVLDVELLYDEFTAAGLEVEPLGAPDFDALVQDMVGAFYLAAAEEPELQEPLKIGLLREMAERMGALTRLAAQQTSFGGRTVQELQQLNLLAVDVADGIGTITDLLQAILQALPNLQPSAVDEQQVVYKGITDALSRAGRGDLIYAEVGSNGQNVAVDQHINMTVGSDLARVQQVLEEIRNSLAQAQSGVSAVELHAIEQNYCQSLIDQFDKLTFRGISPSGQALSLDLEKVYVELKAVADVPEAADTYSADERRFLLEAEERGEASRSDTVAHLDTLRLDRWRAEARRQRESSRLQRRSIGEIVGDPSQRGLVILGDPGSGKSTLLHYLALTHARRRLDPTLTTVPLSPALLPIFVPFAAYDDHLRRTGQALALGDFLALYYEKWRNLPGLQPLFQAALDAGRALLLLDGLDEVLETTTRQHVAEQAGSLIQQWTGRGNRCVVTSRVVGYREARLPGNLPHVTVLDFSRTEIENFAKQWCRTYEVWAAGRETPTALQQAAVEEKALLDDMRSNASVEQLAASPLLLTMLAILRRQVGKLPDRRVELYAVYVRTLIDNRERERSAGARQHAPDRFDPHRAIAHLIELALWLQLNRPSGTARRQDLEQALVTICLRYDGHEEAHKIPERARVKATQDAEAFLQDMRHFAGLLGERGRDAFGFLHLTFQEYFAGRALAKMEPEERWQLIKPCLHQPRWREPILLCAGQLGVIEQRRPLVNDLAQHILEAGSVLETILHRDLFLAAAIAADDVGLPTTLLDQMHRQLLAIHLSNTPVLQAQAITSLGHLSRLGYVVAQQTLLTSLQTCGLKLAMLRILPPFLGETKCQPLLHIVRQCLVDDNQHVRRAAVQALAGQVSRNPQLRDDLRQRLTDDNAYVRRAAVQALASQVSRDAQVRDELCQCLSDSDDDVRRAAVHALAELVSRNPQLHDHLRQRLTDDNEYVRRAAVQALAELVSRNPQLRDDLRQRLSAAGGQMRSEAVYALAGQVSRDAQVRDDLCQCLTDLDGDVRRAAVQALAGLVSRDVQVRDDLRQRLTDLDGDVRRAAVQALAGLVSRDVQVRDDLRQCLTDEDQYVRHAAIYALAVLVSRDAQVRDDLRQCLTDEDQYVRHAAIYALAVLVSRDAQVRDDLRQCLLDRFYDVERAAVQTLAGLVSSNAQVRDDLRQRLTADNEYVRHAAVQALAGLVSRDAQVRADVSQRLADLDDNVRCEAVYALARLVSSDVQVRDDLRQRLTDDNGYVRCAAVYALARLVSSDVQVRDDLRQRLTDNDNDVQSAAVQALAGLVSSDAQLRDDLRQRLTDNDWQMRRAAVHAFAGLAVSDAQVRDDLCQCLTDPDDDVRSAAVYALAGLVGSDPKLHDDLRQCLIDDDWQMRHMAVQAFAGLVSSNAQVRDDLRQRLADDNEYVRRAAVQALADLVNSDVQLRDDLRQRLTDDNEYVRRAAVQALADLVNSDPQVRDDLRQRLADDNGYVRQAAVHALAPLVTIDETLLQLFIPWFGIVVEDFDSPFDQDVMQGTQLRLIEVYAPLLTERPTLLAQFVALLDTTAWPLRLGVAKLLIAMPDGPPLALLPKLRSLLSDMRGEESWPNRLQVAELFINERDRELSQQAITIAVEALDYATQPWYDLPESGPAVRQQAATILGQLEPLYRDEKIFVRLARALEEDKDPHVRDAAYGALLRLAAAPERTTTDLDRHG